MSIKPVSSSFLLIIYFSAVGLMCAVRVRYTVKSGVMTTMAMLRAMTQTKIGGSETLADALKIDFSSEIKEIPNQRANISSLASKTNLEIRDVDCLITVDDVQKSVKRTFGNSVAS